MRSKNCFAAFLLALMPTVAPAQNLMLPYTDPQYQTKLPFGQHSHYIQPWRSTLETVPASRFLNALGMVLNVQDGQSPDLMVQMLARHGIRQTRLEIGWGSLDYDTEKLNLSDKMKATLLACKRWGIRPLILLNGNSGVPCPCKLFDRQVMTAGPQGRPDGDAG